MGAVLVNVSIGGCRPFPALLWNEQVLALWHWSPRLPLFGEDHVTTLYRHWQTNARVLEELSNDPATLDTIAERGVALSSVTIHPPVEPRQVYCTIGNYRSQQIEAALDLDDGPTGALAEQRHASAVAAIEARKRSGEPYICLKGSASVTGPYDELCVSQNLSTLDWEVEVGVVIGRTAANVSTAEALDFVAGYCVVNDLTLRERVFRKDPKALGTDWLQSKSRSGWLPVGPWLVPSWDLPDPMQLRPWLRLNGETMQDGLASDMIFSIAAQLAYLSRYTPLQPGDLLCTGSPAGFGSHHGRYLRPGDIVEAGVDGLGAQRIRCVA